jgi:hypothetical protein
MISVLERWRRKVLILEAWLASKEERDAMAAGLVHCSWIDIWRCRGDSEEGVVSRGTA